MNDENIVTPVGRIVQGSAFVPSDKDQQGNPLTVKTGPNAGKLTVQFYLGLAIDKNNPDWGPFWEKIQNIAVAAWPGGQYNAPGFSWKYIDGDSLDAQGQPYASREGFAGHHIIKLSSGYAPTVVSAGGASVLVEPSQCKRGDYARCVVTSKGNSNDTNPGVYINLSVVEFMGYGEEIKSGPDAKAILAQAAAPSYMPPGMSTTPVANSAPVQPPAQQQVQAPVQQQVQAPVQQQVQAPVQAPVQPQVQAPVQQQTQAPVQPHTEILQPNAPQQ